MSGLATRGDRAMAFAANTRPIEGAVATYGTNERVAFLRRVYGTLGIAILGYVAVAYIFMKVFTEQAVRFSIWALSAQMNWLLLLAAFMGIGYLAERLARSEASAKVQYLGLAIGVIAEAIIVTPLLFKAMVTVQDPYLIHKAGLLTLLIFAGLTATVFVTKKDFTFMRGAL